MSTRAIAVSGAAGAVPHYRRRKINSGYFFVAPAVLLILALAIYPTLSVFVMSLQTVSRMTGATSFVGLDNYATLINDPVFRQAFQQALFFSAVSSAGHILIGLVLALAMNASLNRRFVNVCRSVILLPWALSPIVVAVCLKLWAYPLTSPIPKLFKPVGLLQDFAPLADPSTALWTLSIVNIWQFTPFYMLMILAGLQTLDPELIDAAKVDGAKMLQRIRYVMIPHVREVLLTLALFDLVTTAAYFDLIWITTQGGRVRSTEVLATYTYRIAFFNMNWNLASASGVILLLLSIAIAAVVVVEMQRDH